MKIFLTSDMGCSYKENGSRYLSKINNENGIIEQIKENLDSEDIFMFFCSNPDTYDVNDSYAKLTFDSFNISGFNFKKLIIVDSRYQGNLKEDIESSSLIFLAGGHTETEMKYFNKINLKELLKDYNKVIIGQSAGSLNLAHKVVCAPEYIEEIGTNYTWQGLGKTSVNVEPHFTLHTEEKEIREELLKISNDYDIYAISDGTHIFDDGKTKMIYGECYLIRGGNMEKICENKDKKEIIIMPNSERINYVKLNKKLVDDYIKMLSDKETYSFISRETRTFTREDEEKWVEEKLNDNSKVFSMLEKDTNKFIGNIEVMNHDNEIGICITKDMQDKHYGTEAIKTIIDYCFNTLNYDVVTLKVHNDNPRAIKCYKNAGFIEYNRDEEDIFMHIKRG